VGLPCATHLVVVCQSPQRAEEARSFVETILDKLGLKLSPPKTKIVSYGKGYSFLGFFLSSRSRRMRPKSVRKFKDKVRELTPRKQNFEAKVIVKLYRVIGGTARYFATSFFTSRESFHKLHSWIRMRLRCMKFKRKSRFDNRKLRVKKFTKLGLLTLESFCADVR
jgi:RNA-directed DNA polymerase